MEAIYVLDQMHLKTSVLRLSQWRLQESQTPTNLLLIQLLFLLKTKTNKDSIYRLLN